MAYLAFEWLLAHQLLLSALLLIFIVLERYSLLLLRPNFVYKLVGIIPLAILLANLPSSMKPFQTNAISYYLVKPQLDFANDFGLTWLNAYMLITTLLMFAVFVVHIRFLKDLRLKLLSVESISLTGFKVYESSVINTPMVVGIFKSKLVLPYDYEKQFNTNVLDMIIEHESIHMQRKDNLANGMFLIATILLWFNPLAWMAYGSFRRLQELSCDQKVLHNKTKEQKVLYSKALIDCVATTSTRFMAYSYYGDKQMILQRLSNIKRSGQGSKLAKGGILLAVGLMLSTLVIAKAPMGEKDHKKEVHPISIVDPTYPSIAIEQGLKGVVTLKYDISPDGVPMNLSVVSAKPERIFNREAKRALAQWRYKPTKTGYSGIMVQLEFTLD